MGAGENMGENTGQNTGTDGRVIEDTPGDFVLNGTYRDFSGGNIGQPLNTDPVTGLDTILNEAGQNVSTINQIDGFRCADFKLLEGQKGTNWGGSILWPATPAFAGDEIWIRMWVKAPDGVVRPRNSSGTGIGENITKFLRPRDGAVAGTQLYPTTDSGDFTGFFPAIAGEDAILAAELPDSRFVSRTNPSGFDNFVRVDGLFINQWVLLEHYLRLDPNNYSVAACRVFFDNVQVYHNPWVRTLVNNQTKVSQMSLFDYYASATEDYDAPKEFSVYVRNIAVHVKPAGSGMLPPNLATVNFDAETDPDPQPHPVLGDWIP